ncbi:methyltransferase domain-containing protein [Streptomyces sp. NPDC054765]
MTVDDTAGTPRDDKAAAGDLHLGLRDGEAPRTREQAAALVRASHPAHSDVGACEACGSTDTRPATWRRGFRIAECPACGFLWVDPMPTAQDMWVYYNKRTWKPYPPEVIRSKYAPSVAAVLANVPPGRSVLDVGCDHGHFAALLRDRGYDAAGADIDGLALSYATGHYGLTVYQGDLPDIDFDRRFDAVTILSSLEHMVNPYQVVRAAARVLRPGGVLLISTPRADGLVHAVSRRIFAPALHAWEFLAPPSHLTYFGRGSLRAMLRRAGFGTVTFSHQERDAAYRARELAETLAECPDAPGWARAAYPLLRHLRTPARLLDLGDMTLCIGRMPGPSAPRTGGS